MPSCWSMFRQMCLAGAILALIVPMPAWSQTLDADTLIRGLTRPKQLTRSLNPPPRAMTDDHARFLRGLGTSRSLVEEDARGELATITETYNLPRLDVNILFDFNSDSLQPTAYADLEQIARALKSPGLAEQRFVLAGHTDAVGSASHNLDLSRRRAETVRVFLIAAGVDLRQLVPVGFGAERLKVPAEPRAGANRRVEIINLEVGWK